MNAERFRQIEQLYYRALEVSAAERPAFLAQACCSDEELRREVESLLAAHDKAGSFIDGNALDNNASLLAPLSPEEQPTAKLLTRIGQSINQYRIFSPIGKGGMGEVWLAEDTRLKRKVALKLLPAEFTNDVDRLRRFELEALAISALNHPNIITIHEIGESEAGRFIVMELVAGRTLRALAAETVTLDSLITWGSQLAKAMQVAHAAGITHRDIKPENIMVRDDGYVKVLDFGLARLDASRDNFADADSLAGTKSGVLLGTVKYMSPEQARGEKVTSATDIFALGILFYELATGAHPFNSPTLLGTLQQITSETPLPPTRLKPSVPPALESLILRMLAKQANARPSAAEIEQALSELSGQRTSGQLQYHTKPVVERHTVGHEKERLELRNGFASALNGRGQLLCVTGEPGIGKTTLVEDFLAELSSERQCTIARGRCSERLAGTEAYLPLLEALESLLQGGSIAAVAHMMKQIAPTWYAQVVPLSGESEESARLLAEVKAASQERMKRELANFLQEVARLRPLVLFFDDLHWADVSTIDVLSFLAGKFDVLNVLIVVTYRPSDMLLAKHPFLQIKPDLQARGLCRELLLEFLNAAEIAEYLALEFPQHRFPAEFPKLIHAKTEGSPLFMADLVRYLRDRSVIALTSGMWTIEQALPDIERELPESVRGMIERKIAQLSEEDRKLLTAASVQGYEFDSAVVAQVLNLEADEVEERLEKLERVFAFVKLTSEAEFPNRTLTLKYRFVHVLYQNAMYASLRVTRKASLSAAVAQALLGFYGAHSHSVAGELANLFEVARDFANSAEHFAKAAQQAAQVFANTEAIALAQRGLNALQSLPVSVDRDRQELALQLTLGLSLAAKTFWAAPEVGDVHRRARELCQQQAGNPQFFQVLAGLWSHHLIRAEMETASELARQILQLAEESQDSFMLELAHCFSGITMHHLGEFIAAGRHFEAGINHYRPGQNLPYQTLMAPSVGSASEWSRNFWILGYPERALRKAQQAYDLADSQSNPSTLGFALIFGAFIHQFRREEAACQEKAEAVIILSREKDIADNILWASLTRGWAIARQGSYEEGLVQLREGVAICQSVGTEIAFPQYLAMIAEACICAGQIEAALTSVNEALSLTQSNRDCYYDAELHRLRGELLLLNGATQAEAESCFQQAIKIAQQQNAKSWELRATTSLARLWQRQGRRSHAQQMLAEIYGWFTEGFDTADLKDAKALLDELQQPDARVSSPTVREGLASNAEALANARATDTASRTPSIAVLPFVNISNDPDNEYFCDGLAEELLNALSKIEALHVAARTSAFSFKGKETDIREIGQKLNVGAVLEGSVRKSGNRLRITAQLINIADGYHLWSERYDRELKDIFDIQDEISLSIVDALKVKLLGAEKAAILKRHTDDPEAWEWYQKAVWYYHQFNPEAFSKAIDCLNKAVETDPKFALAWASYTLMYILFGNFAGLDQQELLPKAEAAALKAIELDALLPEAHQALAIYKCNTFDLPGGGQHFRRSLELNPNQPLTRLAMAAFYLLPMGRIDEALTELQRTHREDPLAMTIGSITGYALYVGRRYDEALIYLQPLIEMAPDFATHYLEAGRALMQLGRLNEAIESLQKCVSLSDISYAKAALGHAYGLAGRKEEALRLISELQQRPQTDYEVAVIQTGLGDKEAAFQGLEAAYEKRQPILINHLKVEPWFDSLRADPRFADLLRRIGLPE